MVLDHSTAGGPGPVVTVFFLTAETVGPGEGLMISFLLHLAGSQPNIVPYWCLYPKLSLCESEVAAPVLGQAV